MCGIRHPCAPSHAAEATGVKALLRQERPQPRRCQVRLFGIELLEGAQLSKTEPVSQSKRRQVCRLGDDHDRLVGELLCGAA